MADATQTAPANPTDGPWYVEPAPHGQFLIALADGSVLATVGEGINEGGPPEVVEANARLIAAAPDLEAALEAILDVFLDGRLEDFDEKEERAYRLADAALAKAYGNAA